MAVRNHLFNKRGQILIESIFLVLVVTTVLIVFKQLIEFQKSKKQYRFLKNATKQTKDQTYATAPAVNNTK